MSKTKIRVGKWYRTTVGVGVCVRAGGCFPWAAGIDITQPFPRGVVNVVPRDVLEEVQAP